ncbi:hypothetical protein FB45DRAFT_224160 [Roridomyces roridus]|uniref:DUF6534 domain-containing protein n=1 Tax=Roridomyces roridus TaxID=1738132 RepID=A0AAD7FFI5_9AGAR|nr:hypothetical protein FB45DRAFT_224160 [Roridomyces roridus]
MIGPTISMEDPTPFAPHNTMSTPGPPSFTVDIPKNLGAVLIGALFASVFSGISDLQAMFYFKSYKHDPWPLKLLVSVVWIMDTIHLGFIWSAVWFYLIANYGSQEVIDIIPWQIPMIVIQTSLIVACVDYFYAKRIFVLSKMNWLLTAPVVILICLRLASAIVVAVKEFELKRFSLMEQHDHWLLTFTFGVSAALDAVTSGTLVHLLAQHRVENGRYNRVLDKLILYGLECGCLTFLGSITTMLCWILMKNLVFGGVYFCMGKFYANVLFITLNSRNHVLRGTPLVLEPRARTTNLSDRHYAAHPIEFARGQLSKGKVPSDTFAISVQMERTVHYEVDESDLTFQRSHVASLPSVHVASLPSMQL